MARYAIPLLLLCAALVRAEDIRCGYYPESARKAGEVRLARERAFVTASLRAKAARQAGTAAAASPRAMERINLIDNFIFGLMEADGVTPAPLASDAEFARRVRLDLTGRIAQPEEVTAFLNSSDGQKRVKLVDQLMSSSAYVDKMTQFYANLFEVASNYYNIIGIPGRNAFYKFLRDSVETNRPYDEVARDIITGYGDNSLNGPANFIARGVQLGDPIQDTWDALTDRITTRFLGYKTACISCHGGRPNLRNINLYLYGKTRQNFWGQSAFLSRTNIVTVPIDPFGNAQRTYVLDRSSGAYTGSVPANNPGQRPLRTGGPYTPVYLTTGEAARTTDWRADLAQLVTRDRQFARAAVNYLWAAFFTTGIVDPVDGWDLARIDPKNPPPQPWALQPTHPELIEALAGEFINSGYDVRALVRLLVTSNAYQLSSRHPDYNAYTDLYFARHIPRRLMAEEIYDALSAATATETPMWVEGFAEPLLYAGQLPDITEPRRDFNVSNILNQFGRGDWNNTVRNSNSTVMQVLFLMNDSAVNFRASGTLGGNRNSRIARIMQSSLSDSEAVDTLILATLSRPATAEERAAALKNRRGTRESWLSDLQWALVNKLDFLFNY